MENVSKLMSRPTQLIKIVSLASMYWGLELCYRKKWGTTIDPLLRREKNKMYQNSINWIRLWHMKMKRVICKKIKWILQARDHEYH